MVQESQKRAARKWDSENMSTLGCKVKKEHAETFKAYCAEQGKTSNAVLRDYVLDCIGEPDNAQERPQAGGGLQLSPDALKAAQEAAQATGEAVPQFIERAVSREVERDKRSWKMGINPATREKETPRA